MKEKNEMMHDLELKLDMKGDCMMRWTGDDELHTILCMQGGDDDGSYAKNCEAPASAITLSKPFILRAIHSMNLFHHQTSLAIADLGCATGYNTLATIDLVVQTLSHRYKLECNSDIEFQAFFSDLPSNDFNSLFRSLPLRSLPLRRYYAAGVPGSFYHRLFPKAKLHMVLSLSALHWLSKIPEEVLDKRSSAWNKGRAWIDGAKKEVVEAYAKQSEEDLKAFLRCRREEVVEGGTLFILMGGRDGDMQNQLGDPDSTSKHPFTTTMDQAWQDLLNEGLIEEERRDRFNIPAYMRSIEEVERGFEGSGFEIERVEYKRIMEHSKEKQEEWIRDPMSYGRAKANLVRATLKPMVEAHLGPHLCEELFNRFQRRAQADINMLHKTCFYGLILLSAKRNSS